MDVRGPLAIFKIDEKNCFGMIEWQAVREAASRFAAWKHRNVFFVDQEGLSPSMETLMAPSSAAAEARGSIAARQAAGTFPWIGVNDSADKQRLQAGHAARLQESVNFQLGGTEKLTCAHDPRHALQKSGGLADQWCTDDGDIVCHPTLVLLFLQDFDVANARVGAEQNSLKTDVVHYVIDLDAAPPEWRNGDVRSLAKTSAVTDGRVTLGVAVGSRQFIADQLLSKADVIRAIHERVPLCHEPQTEFALFRVSLGDSRVNHILRVHGRKILEEQSAAVVYDEIGHRSPERLFPGLTEDSMTQATLSASQSGIGFKRARDIAAPAHLGALIVAKPRMRGMIRDAVLAGLLPEQVLKTPAPHTSTHLIDTDEQAIARLLIQKAAQATDESWQLRMTTAMTWTCQRPARAASVDHSSKRSSHDPLIGHVSDA